MRMPTLDKNSKPVESSHSNNGSEKGDPVPGGYIRLSDFIQETGRAFYPSSWTGKECQILSDNGYDFWIESPIERLVRRSIHRQTMRLSYIAKGRTPQEARQRVKFDIECAKRLDRESELKDELNKIEGLLIQQQRDPASFSDLFSEIRLRARWSEIVEELKEYENDYFVDDDLPDPSPQDIKDLNDRFATRIERCKAIKERRQVAIIDGLRGALWRGDIPAGHLSRNGEFVPLSCSIWYQEPEWMRAIVCPYIRSRRDHEPEWKGERRSILVEHAKAKEWVDRASVNFRSTGVIQERPVLSNSDTITNLTPSQAYDAAVEWYKNIFKDDWEKLIPPERQGKSLKRPNRVDFQKAYEAHGPDDFVKVTDLHIIHRDNWKAYWS